MLSNSLELKGLRGFVKGWRANNVFSLKGRLRKTFEIIGEPFLRAREAVSHSTFFAAPWFARERVGKHFRTRGKHRFRWAHVRQTLDHGLERLGAAIIVKRVFVSDCYRHYCKRLESALVPRHARKTSKLRRMGALLVA
jgi:hypothetical protein